MFVTDKLIFVQLQKTGSTHVERCLQALFGGEVFGHRTKKHDRIPKGFNRTGKLIVGSVRDPWDWYVSLWAFGSKGSGGFHKTLTRGPGLGRRTTRQYWRNLPLFLTRELCKPVAVWRKTYSNVDDPTLFRQWLRLLLSYERRYDGGLGYGKSQLSLFAGLLTFHYCRLSVDDAALLSRKHPLKNVQQLRALDNEHNILDMVIRNECIEDGLLNALKRAGYEVGDEMIHRIRSVGRTNASRRRRDLDYYYDDETVELVGEREQFIVEKFGYTPPVLCGKQTGKASGSGR